LRGAALFVAGIAGCSAGDGVIDRTFDPCDVIALDAAGATAAQQAGVDDAVAMWRERGAPHASAVPVDGAPVIPVIFEDADPASHGFYDDVEAVIYINTDLDAGARAIAIAHELGHAFGLYHVPESERTSLMNPHNLAIGPTDEDARALTALWGACRP
jgi:hypothetical protein